MIVARQGREAVAVRQRRKTEFYLASPRLVDALLPAYGWVPAFLRKPFLPFAESAASILRRLFRVASQVRVPIYYLQGREKTGGRWLAALVLGRGPTVRFLAGLLFSELKAERRLGGVFLWDIKSVLSRLGGKADLAFVVLDGVLAKPLARLGFIFIPDWVTFKMNLSQPLEQTWNLSKNKTLRENLRRIRKYGYSYEITRDPKKFDDFYHNLYLPFIPRKFGETTSFTGYQLMKLFFKNGVLLLVKQKEEYVSGNIILLYRQGVKSIIIGVRGGRVDYIRKAALAASYYFTTLWAIQNGFRWIDFGECRPFLNDGILYFKKRWGMSAERYKYGRTVIGLNVWRSSPPARDFLTGNPFIFLDRNRMRGLVFSREDRALDSEDVLSLYKSFFVPGLENLTIVSPQGYSPQAEDGQALSSGQRLCLMEANFKEFLGGLWQVLRF